MSDFATWLRSEWDRVVGFGLIAAGGVAVLVGYQGASGSGFVAEQLSYMMSGGIAGLFLLGAGATFILLADQHDEWRRLDRIERALPGTAGQSQPGLDDSDPDDRPGRALANDGSVI